MQVEANYFNSPENAAWDGVTKIYGENAERQSAVDDTEIDAGVIETFAIKLR